MERLDNVIKEIREVIDFFEQEKKRAEKENNWEYIHHLDIRIQDHVSLLNLLEITVTNE